MSSENLEDFEHFHFPATNCFSNMGWRERLSAWDAFVRHISLVSFNNRAVQTNCSETCYISSKIWDFLLFRNAKLVFIGMSSENLQKNETDTWNESIEIPEIWLEFTILQRIANKLFRNESYVIWKFNILAFQNCFSYFHWNVERESRRLWTFSFSSDQLFFEHGVARALIRLGRPCETHLSSFFQ